MSTLVTDPITELAKISGWNAKHIVHIEELRAEVALLHDVCDEHEEEYERLRQENNQLRECMRQAGLVWKLPEER